MFRLDLAETWHLTVVPVTFGYVLVVMFLNETDLPEKVTFHYFARRANP